MNNLDLACVEDILTQLWKSATALDWLFAWLILLLIASVLPVMVVARAAVWGVQKIEAWRQTKDDGDAS